MTEKRVSRFAIYRKAIRITLRSHHFWHLFVLGLLLIYCILFYYFGELVNLLRWETSRMDFFYGAHDIQRAFFIAPIVYAAYTFGMRASIIITLVVAIVILPHIIFTPNDVGPIWRIIMFIVVAGAVGYVTARVRRSCLPAQRKRA